MNEKTPMEVLDELERVVQGKRQRRYFALAGFAMLMLHAFTQSTLILLAALALLGASVFRFIQIRRHSRRWKALRDTPTVEETKVDAAPPVARGAQADNQVSSISLRLDGTDYELSIQHPRESWEQDDILLCRTGDQALSVHPAVFLEYLRNTQCDYLHNRDPSVIDSLQGAPCLSFGYMDDSRVVIPIAVAGDQLNVMCKYLCPRFFVFNLDGQAMLVVDDLHDADGNEIPPLITDYVDTHSNRLKHGHPSQGQLSNRDGLIDVEVARECWMRFGTGPIHLG